MSQDTTPAAALAPNPTHGGSFTRCPDSHELTCVHRTRQPGEPDDAHADEYTPASEVDPGEAVSASPARAVVDGQQPAAQE